jgi:bacterioferritin (cytochrome b1)
VANDEKMDVPAVIKGLNQALGKQYRSALDFTLLAGSVRGFSYQALGDKLWGFAEEELADARRIVEKVTALGGQPATDAESSSWKANTEATVQGLIAAETDCIDTLKACIPYTGQEGRSEALEHLLEHIILRKQNQVDLLLRLQEAD